MGRMIDTGMQALGMSIIVCNDDDYRETVAAKEIADLAGPALALTYPGYRWRIEPFPHPTKPFVRIRVECGNARYGSVIRLWEYYSASSAKAAILREGGELLERFRLSRRAYDEAQVLALPRNAAGLVVHDL